MEGCVARRPRRTQMTGFDAAAAVLLIHELLHAIGLGENPPASEAITARVVARCGH
jgi:hypothetical protein